MGKLASFGFIVSISLYAAIHFIDLFFPLEVLPQLLSLLGFFVLLFAFLHTKGKEMMLPLLLMISSLIIILVSSEGAFFVHLGEGFRQMRSLAGLLFIVPIVSWVLRYESYIEDVMIFFQKQLYNSKRFYIGLTSVTQVISYFLLVGTIPVMSQILRTILEEKKEDVWETYKITILLRGFALGTLWIISVPSFSYAIQSTGTPLSIAILQGFFASLFGVILAVVFLFFQEKKHKIDLSKGIQAEILRVLPHDQAKGRTIRHIIEFFLLFFSLLGSIVALHLLFEIDILVVIPLVVIGWTFLYFVLKRDLSRLFHESKYYFIRGVPLKAKEMSIILSAGLLIYSLHLSGWGSLFVEAVYARTENVAFINFLTVLPLIVVLLGFIGLSPLTVMVLLGEIIQSIELPYSSELILLALTLGSSLTIMLSPLGIPVIILSNENGRTPWANSFKINWAYACTFYLFVEAYVQIRLF